MSHPFPFERNEEKRGFFGRRKSFINFRIEVVNPGHARDCGLALFRALAAEFSSRRRIESITAVVIGSTEASREVYESFTKEAQSNDHVAQWLTEDLPCFSLNFETPDGQILRSYEYETVDGKRMTATWSPMDQDEKDAATERIKTGLNRLEGEQREGGSPNL
jgi:hypothetical protein